MTQPPSEKEASAKQAAEKVATGKKAAAKQAPEKQAAAEKAAGKQVPEKASAKKSPEKQAAAKQAAETPVSEINPEIAARRMLGHTRKETWGPPAAAEAATPAIQEGESWMVAYLDLITLLLTLFVILGSLSHSRAGVNVKQGLERAQQAEQKKKEEQEKRPDATVKRTGSRQGMEEEFHRVIGSNSLGGVLDIKVQPGRIRLQMDAKALFTSGSAELKPSGMKMMTKVAELFGSYGSQLSIEGHTDSIPVSGGRFGSNWELSSARAVTVVEALEALGVPRDRMRAVGLADTHPIAPNDTAKGRARNRRVDFVMELGPETVRKRLE